MKKITLIMISIWLLLGISSSFALPMRVSAELPTGVYGRYYPNTNTIWVSTKTPESEVDYVYKHELGHWVYFEKMSRFQRTVWKMATRNNPYEPTDYSAERDNEHYPEENFAECYANASLYGVFPPENTKQYLILKNLLK